MNSIDIEEGGMPLAISLETHEEKSRYLKDLFDRTYIKDVLERHEITYVGIEQFLLNEDLLK